jgi:hypothetical protein
VLSAALPGEDALAGYCLAVVDQAIRAHRALPHEQGGRLRPPLRPRRPFCRGCGASGPEVDGTDP